MAILRILIIVCVLALPAISQIRVTGEVVAVESGNTFILHLGEHADIPIRLRLIETPTDDQELFETVRQHLSEFLLGKTISLTIRTLEGDASTAVFVSGVEISQQMVRDGAGWFLDDPSIDSTTRVVFKQLEGLAKNEKRGVWGIDGLIKPSLLSNAAKQSSDPTKDSSVATLAWRTLGPAVEDVFGSEIYSVETGNCAGRIVGITDGDTVTILTSDNRTLKVRLEGIDAPEKAQSCGMRSKQYLSALIYGKTVGCSSQKRDRYGRLIAKITSDGVDINRQMISSGNAWHYKKYESEQLPADRVSYSQGEQVARANKTGLWNDCDQTPPWEFRKNKFLAEFTNTYEGDLGRQISAPYYFPAAGSSSGGSIHVKGYYRKDGTYVRPHTRSSPR
jgi:endonuclease YncB( thermonuclease family)